MSCHIPDAKTRGGWANPRSAVSNGTSCVIRTLISGQVTQLRIGTSAVFLLWNPAAARRGPGDDGPWPWKGAVPRVGLEVQRMSHFTDTRGADVAVFFVITKDQATTISGSPMPLPMLVTPPLLPSSLRAGPSRHLVEPRHISDILSQPSAVFLRTDCRNGPNLDYQMW
jgi:hypothetical protein